VGLRERTEKGRGHVIKCERLAGMVGKGEMLCRVKRGLTRMKNR
jgi:hypothetical protein